jgi:hypothetical protein
MPVAGSWMNAYYEKHNVHQQKFPFVIIVAAIGGVQINFNEGDVNSIAKQLAEKLRGSDQYLCTSFCGNRR